MDEERDLSKPTDHEYEYSAAERFEVTNYPHVKVINAQIK